MKWNQFMTALIAAALCVSSAPLAFAEEPEDSEETAAMRDITTMELVREMGVGINLGNTYESCGDWIAKYGDGTPESYETAWGSPVITEAMIQGYADAGFGVLRIPVAWSNLMGEDYTLSSAYVEAVQEVVDWTLDAGMYAIVNIHYDGGWFSGFSTDKDTCMEKYSRIWTQLCEAFGVYNDYLMFESLNEEGCWDDIWNRYSGTAEQKAQAFGLLAEINQTFVDIVRGSGGNNGQRHLLIAGYATDVTLTCDEMFTMPEDPMQRCAVSVHYYSPPSFAILEEDASWAKASSTWGTDSEIAQLNQTMDLLETTFIDQGIPVIIGEYGCPKKNKEADSVRMFLSSVCEAAFSRQICPVLWDTTNLHYSRSSCTMIDQELQTAFQTIAAGELLMGDVNGDWKISVADAVMLQKYLVASETLTEKQAQHGDCDENQRLNGFDLLAIMKLLEAA